MAELRDAGIGFVTYERRPYALLSFQTLMGRLSAIVRNICRVPAAKAGAPTIEITTTPDKIQQAALTLLEKIAL